MASINDQIKEELRVFSIDYLAEEFEVKPADIKCSSKLVDDLGGDSLMFIQMIELLKKNYNLDIDLQTIGKYLMINPITTIDNLITLVNLLYEHENNIVNIELQTN